jgi:hypothetical protein
MTNGRRKTEMGKTAFAVAYQLALEMLGVKPQDEDYIPTACFWGIEHESEAILVYSEKTMNLVKSANFEIAPDLLYVGGTSDGLIGSNGLIEVKCPYNSINHINFKESLKDYIYQSQGYLWVYNREWLDIVSYDPRFPVEYQLLIKRIYRDESIISSLRNRCMLAYETAQKIRDNFHQHVVMCKN